MITQYKTTPKPKKALPVSFPIKAEVCKTAETPMVHGNETWTVLDLIIPNDGKPCRPKIEAAIAAEFPGYRLITWWMPEPTDEF